MAPPRILEGESPELFKRSAKREYPDVDEATAESRYLRKTRTEGVFFTDEFGKRCIWGPVLMNTDVHNPRHLYCGEPQPAAYKYNKFATTVMLNRIAHICYKPVPLSYIDRPAPKGFRFLTGHRSERGWTLPRSHKRNFFQFPPEIRARIFEFVLTAPSKKSAICPQIVRGSWKAKEMVTYEDTYIMIDNGDQYEPSPDYAHVNRRDKDGPFIEKRLITRPLIDATCLRTCKRFYQEGCPILYGKNTFGFGMASSHSWEATPQILPGGNRLHHPNPHKPGPEEWHAEIKEAIVQVEQRRPVFMLSGWVYYDPFIRFLHKIGPRNAPSLRHLRFNGTIKIHTCKYPWATDEVHLDCRHDLYRSMRLYTYFINKFCPSVDVLSIVLRPDEFVKDGFIVSEDPNNPNLQNPNNLPVIPPWRVTSMQDEMTKLLEKSLWHINSLRKIEVLQWEWNIGDREWDIVPLRFDEPVVEQTLEKVKKRREEQLERKIQLRTKINTKSKKVQCGFCGEDNHVWGDCFNLCALCGEYGHFRDTCTNWSKIRSQWAQNSRSSN
ncbi:hypothetical protein HYALB_00003801 [Hymenoscyphus albidus]|uniref:CCHC-type domain-containing protein n=1 Tax=Hymenoscyphus albidus TaxID=595503 RepID=A0A9N9QAZ0_9HELO|nr:hypothetical protein HYALB_00003801 [Hymenoscyphus albidus]